MLIDAAATDNADLLITLHSQSLYTALKRAPKKNILFALTSNPFILGAGNSDTEHLDNVSGVYYVPASDLIIDAISKCLPAIDKLGIIFKTGDIESAFQKQIILEAAQSKKIEIIESGFTAESEISEAVMSLIDKRVNALFQIYDSYNEISLPVLSKKCGDAKIPLFGYGCSDRLDMGMTMTAERPYEDMGKIFANMIISVLKGTKPGNLPFLSNEFFNGSLYVNSKAAAATGLKIPNSVLAAAEKIAE
nr:ABC transporter substrate binding protein [bacterium]